MKFPDMCLNFDTITVSWVVMVPLNDIRLKQVKHHYHVHEFGCILIIQKLTNAHDSLFVDGNLFFASNNFPVNEWFSWLKTEVSNDCSFKSNAMVSMIAWAGFAFRKFSTKKQFWNARFRIPESTSCRRLYDSRGVLIATLLFWCIF